MSEMIERVARAIDPAAYDVGLSNMNQSASWHFESRRKIAESQALAAIEAMRLPTEEMIDAGYDCGYEGEYGWENDDPEPTWIAMITEALK